MFRANLEESEGKSAIGEQRRTLYAIDDPLLLENMVLSKSAHHPDTGVVLLTHGSLLSERMIQQLKKMGVTNVEAEPLAEQSILEAVEQSKVYLQSIEQIISVKGQSVNNVAVMMQEMKEFRELRSLMREQMQKVFHYFNSRAIDGLVQLNNHHPNSAHHSIITAFNAMAIARELGWQEEEVLELAMAAMVHDVGKSSVPLNTLDWPGRLSDTQWKDMHLHTLFGGKLLHADDVSVSSMVALNHHEWYAAVPGKGYGSLTLFREMAREELGLDVERFLGQASARSIEMIQISTIADMVAALEEIRSYKGALPPFKVLVIMNEDARMGHFNPKIYRAWHATYLRKHKQLLPKGMRFALPREKEERVEQAGKSFIVIQALVRRFSYEELKQLGLLRRLGNHYFDLEAIRQSDGIAVDRMLRRGMNIDEEKCRALGINLVKPIKVILPAMEKRLVRADLLELGFSEKKLAVPKVVKALERAKNGLSLAELNRAGITVEKELLAALGERINRKIFYDLVVVEELGYSRALFAIVREGDRLEVLDKADAYNDLDPLQDYLLNKIGPIEIDFSDLTVDIPSMNHLVCAPYWQISTISE
ncbi:HD-GYP domain-containing protein [Candidatus Magnetaquicoccus inordinatus]|uniref:HD-GYP domain-containing protein n=1 Tax=Candidatus Magnetaquicoccus inordinatus TaxID=2496818 RepID=UPI00102D07D0|nr:HD domain-containing protein [Candidatus Magnetaquicoccus inordinatus]